MTHKLLFQKIKENNDYTPCSCLEKKHHQRREEVNKKSAELNQTEGTNEGEEKKTKNQTRGEERTKWYENEEVGLLDFFTRARSNPPFVQHPTSGSKYFRTRHWIFHGSHSTVNIARSYRLIKFQLSWSSSFEYNLILYKFLVWTDSTHIQTALFGAYRRTDCAC